MRLELISRCHGAEFQNKKVVLVSVPGAFTPTCQADHISGYKAKFNDLKAKGVDQVVVIAYNDPFVMSAWGKANSIQDESIVCVFCHLPSASPLLPQLVWGRTSKEILC